MATFGLTETYNDVQEIIIKTVRAFHRKYGGDIDELTGEANLHFLAAYDSYDMNFGKSFDNWVRYVIWKRLLETVRQNAKRKKILGERVPLHQVCEEEGFNLNEFMSDLSEDATTVVRILFYSDSQTKTRLQSCLKGMGWSLGKIFETFSEITRILRGD